MKLFKLSKFRIFVISLLIIVVSIGAKLSINSQNEKNYTELNKPVIVENELVFTQTGPVIEEKEVLKNKIDPESDKYFATAQSSIPVFYNVKTSKPVVFLGIDDGIKKSPEALEFFRTHKWPMTMFINQKYYGDNLDYFKEIVKTGANIGSHTINHFNLNNLTYAQQKTEICNSQDAYQRDFGTKAKFFRPPYGNFNQSTKIAAKECGHSAIIHWKATVNEGVIYYQTGNKLNPGDIVLMHFRPRVMDDLNAFKAEITKQGLTVQNLNDWIE